MTQFDTRQLRNAFGCFPSGVTIVSLKDEKQNPTGITVSSFSSLSLDPPLCLFSIGKYEDAISDAKAALMKNSLSMEARHNLGKALYSSGQFETALLHFYRASRYL